jgi:hypothetical protein
MIKIKVKNADAINRAYTQIPQIMNKRMKEALERSIAIVESAAKRKTPVDKGGLRRSIRKPKEVRKGDRQVYLGSNLPYARRQHEELHYRHNVGQAKYLEKGLEESKSKVTNIFKKMISDVIVDLKRLSKSL